MNEIKGFETFCNLVLPLVYSDELSYYEQMCKVEEKLNEVISQTNLNSQQVEDLTNFVNNYFNNLDLQQEINTKLNEMASDGTLAEIINSQFYRSIRNSFNKRGTCIIMADSYGLGTSSGGIDTSWSSKLKNLLTPFFDEIILSNTSGAGMSTSLGENMQFSNILNNITPSRGDNDVSMIVCCGGINDAWNINFNNVNAGVSNFQNVVYNKFPNANAFIGCISFSSEPSVWKNWGLVVQSWKNRITWSSTFYIPDSENVMILKEYISNDKTHPTSSGQNAISNFLFRTLRSGYAQPLWLNQMTITLTANDDVSIDTKFDVNIHGENMCVNTTGIIINFNSPVAVKTDLVSLNTTVGTWDCSFFLPTNRNNFNMLTSGYFVESGTNKPCTCVLWFNTNGNLTLGVLGPDCETHNITKLVLAPIKKTFLIRDF